MSTEKLNTEEVEIGFDPYEIVECCICGEKIPWIRSHNPWPIVDDEESRCCSVCNDTEVLPARDKLLRDARKMEESKEELSLEQAIRNMDGFDINIWDFEKMLGKLDGEGLFAFKFGRLYKHMEDNTDIRITLPLTDLYDVYWKLRRWSLLFNGLARDLDIDLDLSVGGLAFKGIQMEMDNCANNIFHVIK